MKERIQAARSNLQFIAGLVLGIKHEEWTADNALELFSPVELAMEANFQFGKNDLKEIIRDIIEDLNEREANLTVQ